MTHQSQITLPKFNRGVYLITKYIEPHIGLIKTGIINIFLQHTSASLAINENYEKDVRLDVEDFLNSLIPDCWSGFRHTLEGCDDMSAHMKNIFIGSSLTIPISNGKLNLGTWQGIYLLEHRDYASNRNLIITQIGE
jgi:secondary thiamine-phosphate synthase enzyme